MLEKRAIAWRTAPRERIVVVGGPQGKYHLTQDGQALNAADPRRSMALEQLLAQTETCTQTLYLRPVAGTEVITHSLSSDMRETYYQLIAWVPGMRLILAAEGMLANSLWSWGVPLVTISFTECPL